MIGAIQTALSGLKAASTKVEASANNIANMDTVGALKGDPAPYAPEVTVQQAIPGGGVTASNVSKPGFTPSFNPGSPFADSDGLVGAPNVDLANEIVNLDIAKIAYKANAKVINTASEMQDDLLKILDKKV
jgi:flagellar basal-body rod protein FlgC